jgi:hypothetical protein
MHALVATLLALSLSAGGWETLSDPALGVEVLRPAGWPVEALANDALAVKAPAPLQGVVVLLPVSAPGAGARALVAGFAARLGGVIQKEAPLEGGHAALVQFVDAGAPGVPRTALVAAIAKEGRGVIAVLSSPAAEWEAARPALVAIAQGLRLRPPQAPAATAQAEASTQRYELFHELKEQAFSGELPADWKKELAVTIMPGASPYVRASAVGRSTDSLYAYLHYKLASFQEPLEELASSGAGSRPYQPGGEVLEKYLFPAVASRSPQDFAGWRITRRGGLQSLFSHPSGVRFDGEAVEYTYRFRGEVIVGHAYVTTYELPGKPAGSWFLYGLYGYEAPATREAPARAAAQRLISSFTFEGRYAPQADLIWALSRDSALKALSPEKIAGPESIIPHRATATGALEAVALGMTDVADPSVAKPIPLQAGVAAALGSEPSFSGEAFGGLRAAP